MTIQIDLPRLAGTRDLAQQIVADTVGENRDAEVKIYARRLSTATVSFADELVRSLQLQKVHSVSIEGAPPYFATMVQACASRRNFSAIHFVTAQQLLTV